MLESSAANRDRYDLGIVGAGYAGLNAAFVASEYLPAAARILLLDKYHHTLEFRGGRPAPIRVHLTTEVGWIRRNEMAEQRPGSCRNCKDQKALRSSGRCYACNRYSQRIGSERPRELVLKEFTRQMKRDGKLWADLLPNPTARLPLPPGDRSAVLGEPLPFPRLTLGISAPKLVGPSKSAHSARDIEARDRDNGCVCCTWTTRPVPSDRTAVVA